MSIYAIKQQLANSLGVVSDLNLRIQRRKKRYIFAYHRVITEQQAKEDGAHSSMWITPQRLTKQIHWMQSIGEIVDYSRIVNFETSNEKPWFALSFDDGWKDNYQQAFPVLKALQVPAVIFLATYAVDNDAIFWPEDISTKVKHLLKNHNAPQIRKALLDCWPEAKLGKNASHMGVMTMVERWIENLKFQKEGERQQRIDYFYNRLKISKIPLPGYIMNWDEAREMQKWGIRFGSHTHNHTIVKGLPKKIIESELRSSKELISQKLQIEVDTFCYPNARYNGKEGAILARCGYRYGFCLNNRTLHDSTDNYYIPRFLTSERLTDTPSYFNLRLLEVPFFRAKPHNPKSVWA